MITRSVTVLWALSITGTALLSASATAQESRPPGATGKEWIDMNYGPFLTTATEIEKGNIAYKGISIRLDEGKIFPVRVELKVGVHGGSRINTILTRRKHHKVFLTSQRDCRELPLRQFRNVVGQVPSIQIDRGVTCIEDFDPVRAITF